MKRSLTILFLLGLASWSNEREEPSILLFERNGIFYEYASEIPFDGKVITGIWHKTYKKGKLYVVESFHADEIVKTRDFYKNGKLHGTSTSYWYDGEKIRHKQVFIDGQLIIYEKYDDGKFVEKILVLADYGNQFRTIDATMGIGGPGEVNSYDFLKQFHVEGDYNFNNFSKQQEDLLRDLLTSPGPLKIKDGPFP